MSPKRSSKFLKGVNRTLMQTIKPSHRHRPQIGREHLAHQSLILLVNSHSLIEVANMFHRIRSAIIHGEHWLSKPPRELPTFYPTSKRRFRNLVKSPAHSIAAQTFARWTLIPTLIMAILIIRKRLTRKSPWPRPIAVIPIVIRRRVRA